VYMLTGCQHESRGITDMLLVFSACCWSYWLFHVLVLGMLLSLDIRAAKAQSDFLHAKVAAYRSRNDPNILVLDVGTDRARRFIAEEETCGVESSCSCCAKYCRVWTCCAVLFVTIVYYDCLQARVFTRLGGFALVFSLMCVLYRIRACSQRTKAYQEYQKQQKQRQKLQKLQVPQELILFYNVPDATEGNPGGLADNSYISFGDSHFSFAPTQEAIGECTRTRILRSDGQTGDILEFTVSCHRQQEGPGLLPVVVRTESTAGWIPLESHHVEQVREWLQERRAVFAFETVSERELAQP